MKQIVPNINCFKYNNKMACCSTEGVAPLKRRASVLIEQIQTKKIYLWKNYIIIQLVVYQHYLPIPYHLHYKPFRLSNMIRNLREQTAQTWTCK